MKKELITHEDPKSTISEIFRTLRTNIQFMNNRNKLQTLLITSTLPSEGKSWTSANLAVTFAQAGKKVVVVDADMRKGRQYKIFGIPPKPGLSNYLADYSEANGELDLAKYLKPTEVEGLFLIPAGNVPPNPSELLVSEAMINLIEDLKQISDIVILDGPPTQLVTDSLILTRMVDSTVIVTASNQTKKEDLKRIADNIEKVGGKIAGIVLNKVEMSSKKYEQSYYYGSSSAAFNDKQKKSTPIQKKAPILENKEQSKTNKVPSTELNNIPVALRKPSAKTEKAKGPTIDKANDILKQINEYIDQEKKNLK